MELAPSARCNSSADLAARLPQLLCSSSDVQLASKAISQLRQLAKLAHFVQLDCCGLDLTQGGLQGTHSSVRGNATLEQQETWRRRLVEYWDSGTGGVVSKAFADAEADAAGVTLQQLASRWSHAHSRGTWRVKPDLAKASAELQQLAEEAAQKIAAKEAATAAAAAAAAEAAAQQPLSRRRSGAERSEAAQGSKRLRAK